MHAITEALPAFKQRPYRYARTIIRVITEEIERNSYLNGTCAIYTREVRTDSGTSASMGYMSPNSLSIYVLYKSKRGPTHIKLGPNNEDVSGLAIICISCQFDGSFVIVTRYGDELPKRRPCWENFHFGELFYLLERVREILRAYPIDTEGVLLDGNGTVSPFEKMRWDQKRFRQTWYNLPKPFRLIKSLLGEMLHSMLVKIAKIRSSPDTLNELQEKFIHLFQKGDLISVHYRCGWDGISRFLLVQGRGQYAFRLDHVYRNMCYTDLRRTWPYMFRILRKHYYFDVYNAITSLSSHPCFVKEHDSEDRGYDIADIPQSDWILKLREQKTKSA